MQDSSARGAAVAYIAITRDAGECTVGGLIGSERAGRLPPRPVFSVLIGGRNVTHKQLLELLRVKYGCLATVSLSASGAWVELYVSHFTLCNRWYSYVYCGAIPWEIGKIALQCIYPDHPKLWEQWCGNVDPRGIAMPPEKWVEFLLRLDGVQV